jgi:hypothetical protein
MWNAKLNAIELAMPLYWQLSIVFLSLMND